MICWFFHRRWHVPLLREGYYTRICCAKCEHVWHLPRDDEHRRLSAQKVVHTSNDNPYDLSDWAAYRDGYDPGEPDYDGGYTGGDPIGYGRTKYEAIRDLIAEAEA